MLEEDHNMIVEEEIDQEHDYTEETTSLRSSLLRRIIVVLVTSILFVVVTQIDDNYVFNPVTSQTFLLLGFVVFVIALVLLYQYRTQSIDTFYKQAVYEQTKRQNNMMDFLVVLPVLMLLFTVVNTFLFSFSPISGTSMEPNFHDDESVVFSHWDKDYERFDVIIIYVDDLSDPYLIKRVIGLPGETVAIRNNEVYINDVLLPQDFIDQTTVMTYCIGTDDRNNCEYTVPDDSYFVLGDNRDGNGYVSGSSGYSIDSRSFGPVHRDDTFGKVVLTFPDIPFLSQE